MSTRRDFVAAGIAITAGLSAIATAPGAVIAADGFEYVSGPLNGQNGGVGAWTAGWVGFGLNASFSMAVTNDDPPPKSAERDLTIQAGTSVVFVSFEIAPPVGATVNDYYLVRMLSGATVVASIGKPAGASTWSIGQVSFVSTGIPASDAARIVAAYDFRGDGARHIWINPDGSDFFNVTTGASSADAVQVGAIPAQASTVSLEASIEGVTYDSLVIASDPGDVGLMAPGAGDCAGDVDGDGATTASDFTVLAGNFGVLAGAVRAEGDLNGDGAVTAADFSILAGDLGCT